MRKFIALALLAACNKPATGPGRQIEGQAVETQAANAGDQKPAFAGQTRAAFKTTPTTFATQVVAKGLEHPWSLAFLPDGRMLVTERPGRLRVVAADGALSPPIAGLLPVDARDQGGLFEIALDPAFAQNRTIFWTFAHKENDVTGTALARGTLDLQGMKIEKPEIVWKQQPMIDSTMHYGGRILFKDGKVYVTTGERSILEGRKLAQDPKAQLGKVMVIDPDAKAAEIFSIGHRNVQAAAWHPTTNALWVVDHGAKGGDEINIVEQGKDYGWPTITYGIEYQGDKIGEGLTQKAGMEQPIYYWDPVIAPSGMAFYTGDKFPAWQGSLFVGGLAGKHVARLTLEGKRIVGEERLLVDRARFRDVRVGPDGMIYLLTDEDQGELLRLAPSTDAPATKVGAS